MNDDIREIVAGEEAYVVGGAVRDELLGLPTTELDFVVPGVEQAELRAALDRVVGALPRAALEARLAPVLAVAPG